MWVDARVSGEMGRDAGARANCLLESAGWLLGTGRWDFAVEFRLSTRENAPTEAEANLRASLVAHQRLPPLQDRYAELFGFI